MTNKYIRGFGEINQDNGTLLVSVDFQFYSPELSKDIFKSDVTLYKKYINKLFNKNNIEFFLSPLFRTLKTKGYEFKSIDLKNKKIGNIFDSFEKIYQVSELTLEFDINLFEEIQSFGNIINNKTKSHTTIINDIQKGFDNFLEQLQETEHYNIMFVPNEMSFVRSERKTTIFNTIAKVNQFGMGVKV